MTECIPLIKDPLFKISFGKKTIKLKLADSWFKFQANHTEQMQYWYHFHPMLYIKIDFIGPLGSCYPCGHF